MTPFWHPLSALLLPEPRSFVTARVLRMFVSAGERVELIYAGDRMWPTLRHGAAFPVEPTGDANVLEGACVVAKISGSVDLGRVSRVLDDDRVVIRADADPAAPVVASRRDVFASVPLARRRLSRFGPRRRRLQLDLLEALRHGPDGAGGDPAGTVLKKYDGQAPMYAVSDAAELDPDLGRRLEATLGRPGRVLVAGSGTGRECFALTRAGWEVVGVDFAPEMVRLAREAATREGLKLTFAQADLRRHDEQPGSLAGVLFTYDVYSFIPRREDRVALLGKIREWLAPGGAVFLSARRARRGYERWILGLQWLASRGRQPWGSSHTRYLDTAGRLRRSYVHYFTHGALKGEVEAAGFRWVESRRGHVLLRPDPPSAGRHGGGRERRGLS